MQAGEQVTRPPTTSRTVASTRLRRAATAALIAVAAGWPASLALWDGDGPTDLRGFVSWWARFWSAVPWTATAILVLVAAAHHLAAAAAARAAAGRRLPWGEAVAAQFAASAANRLTPAGLGGDAVNARFFTRRGGLGPAESLAAVSALVALGALADLTALAAIVLLAAGLGVPGVGPYISALARAVTRVPVGAGWWWAIGASAVVFLAVVPLAIHHRGRRAAQRLIGAARRYGATIRHLVADPRRMLTLSGASAATTLVLGAGFATTAVLAGVPERMFGSVVIGYMVGSALGNVVPVPGGVGTTDAALVGVLSVAGMPVTQAAATALLFRVVTFWLPAAAGVPALRALRSRHAI